MRDTYTNAAIIKYYIWLFDDADEAILNMWSSFKCSIDGSNDAKQLMMKMETGHA